MPAIEPFYPAVGRQVRLLRLRAGLSQDALGARLRPALSRASITNIETGKQRILAHTLVDLARALGVSVTDMVEPTFAPTQRRGRGASEGELDAKLLVRELAQALSLNQKKARALASELGLAEQGGT